MANYDTYYKTEDLFGEPYPELIDKIAKQINKNGLICICIQDTGKKVTILKVTIDNSGIDYEILNNYTLIYKYEDKESEHKSETKYYMYIVRKK